MTARHGRKLCLALGCVAFLGAGAAQAVDGATEINDASVMAAGGYPFGIGASGSYVLTGNLTPPAGLGALVVTAPSVEIDLNGFGLVGAGAAASDGIEVLGIGTDGTVVKDGSITGFGAAGISGGSNLKVFRMRISGNATGIAGASDCLIAESVVAENGGVGIDVSGCKIENNVVQGNANTGISGSGNLVVHNKIVSNGFGGGGGGVLAVSGCDVQENAILRNFNFGVSDVPGNPPGPVPKPPGVPFPAAPPLFSAPNNIMKNVIDGNGGGSPGIGIFMKGSALVSDNNVTAWGLDGIVCSVSCTLRGNQVHSNNTVGAGNGGVTVGPGSSVDHNSIAFNTGVGLVIAPTAGWTGNTLDANTDQDMTLGLPIGGPASLVPHPSSGFENLCSGAPAPVPAPGPGTCP